LEALISSTLSVEVFRQDLVVAGLRCSFSPLDLKSIAQLNIHPTYSKNWAQSPAPLREEKTRCRSNHD
jgi:hypothetical protein